jgi:hypothetical protein
MQDPPISDALRRFLLSGALTVPHVEAILQLRGTPDQPWEARNLAQRLYLRPDVAAGLLSDLIGMGLVEPDTERPESVRYLPATMDLAELMEQLALAYTTYLGAVARLIHSAEGRKAHAFADAFRFKKET